MDDVLLKPFSKQDLILIIEKHSPKHRLKKEQPEKLMSKHILSEIIEPQMLESLLEIENDNQQGFVFELLDIFLNHAELKLAEVKLALKEKDRKKIRDIAHNLKGSSGNVGLTKISRLFADLQDCSTNADWTEIEQQLGDINFLYNQTKQNILKSKP